MVNYLVDVFLIHTKKKTKECFRNEVVKTKTFVNETSFINISRRLFLPVARLSHTIIKRKPKNFHYAEPNIVGFTVGPRKEQ